MNHAGGDEHSDVLVWNSQLKPEFIPCFGNVLEVGQTPL